MAYRQFDNVPETGQSSIATSSVATVISAPSNGGQPSVVMATDQSLAQFAPKARTTKNIGIALLIFGIISLLMGIIAFFLYESFIWYPFTGSGIWSGIFIIVAGSLCISAGVSPGRYATRCAALVFNIITVCCAVVAGIIAFAAFITLVICKNDCYYNSWDGRYHCWHTCPNTGIGIFFTILNFIFMSTVFGLSLAASIYTGRGCCSPRYQTAYVLQTPNGQQQTLTVTSGHHQQMANHSHQEGSMMPPQQHNQQKYMSPPPPYSQQPQYMPQHQQQQQQQHQQIPPMQTTQNFENHQQHQTTQNFGNQQHQTTQNFENQQQQATRNFPDNNQQQNQTAAQQYQQAPQNYAPNQ